MIKRLVLIWVFVFAGVNLSAAYAGAGGPEYAPGEMIVKLREGKTLEEIKELNDKYKVSGSERVFPDIPDPKEALAQLQKKLSHLSAEHQSWYWQLDKDSKEYKDYIAKIEREKEEVKAQIKDQEALIARLEQRQKRAPEGAGASKLDNIYTLKTDPATDILRMAEEYQQNPAVEYAQPNHRVELDTLPNDTYLDPDGDGVWSKGAWGQDYEDLWGLKKIEADKAWGISQGEAVIVAVIDTGVDYNHEDIRENILTKADGSIYGYDFSEYDSDPMDSDGHGTHVAGTVAAIGNNHKGIIGVAPKAKIMPLKIFPNTYGNVSSAAIKYAADNGADILQNSWSSIGREASNPVVEEAIKYAYAKGCVIVFAAGNDNDDVAYYSPANAPEVITVAATTQGDRKSSFSNYGAKIDVAAPGSQIFSLSQGAGYVTKNGTSMACPHVSGLAALILAKNPGLSNEEVRQRIRISAEDIDQPGFDINTGYGRINPARALGAVPLVTAKITSPNFYQSLNKGLSSIVNIVGSAGGPDFSAYQLFYASKANPGNWIAITTRVTTAKLNGFLASWNIKILPIGEYLLKLVVTSSDGRQIQYLIEVSIKDVRQITTNGFFQNFPAVFGNYIVWEDHRNGDADIYLFDLRTNSERRITSDTQYRWNSAISDKYITWVEYRNNRYDICLFNLLTHTEQRITDDAAYQWNPSLSGNYIAWEDYRNGNADIYLFDLATNTERQISFDNAAQTYPAISGNYIAWEDNRNGNSDIYLFDLSANTERRITNDAASQWNPSISGNYIVWQDNRNGNSDIYLFDLSANTERRITANPEGQTNPAVSGSYIVWQDYRNGKPDIYLFDLRTNSERRIAANVDPQSYPAISGNYIVWSDRGDIYLVEIDKTPPTKPLISAPASAQRSGFSFSWSSSDPESGIAEYQYRIKAWVPVTTCTYKRVGFIKRRVCYTWQALALDTSWVSAGANTQASYYPPKGLQPGIRYYISVRAKNGAGLWSAEGTSAGTYINP